MVIIDSKLECSLSFNRLDYGARFYDPVINRLPSLDPVADNFYHFSPYDYANGYFGDIGSLSNFGVFYHIKVTFETELYKQKLFLKRHEDMI